MKTSWRCFENVLARRLEDVLKTSWRRLENVLKTSWRRIAKTNILVLTKTSWRRLEDVFWRRKAKANIFVLIKTSWRRLEDALKRSWRRFEDVLKTSWRHMAKTNILVLTKTSSEDVRLRRTHSSWWRRLLKTKTKDVFKTSSRRLHQDECLLGYFYVQTSQQPTLKMFSLPQPFRQFRLHQVTRGSCEDWHCLNSLFFHKIWIVITGGSQSLIPYRSGPENWSTAGIGLWWRCLQLEWQTTQSTFSHTLNLLSLLSYPTNTITRTHSLLETICLTWFSS